MSETEGKLKNKAVETALSLRDRLSNDAKELYDYVLEHSPEDQNFVNRMNRCPGEIPFRHLVRSAKEGTTDPKKWSSKTLTDSEIVAIAEDTEVRIAAWSLLMDDSPNNWKISRQVQIKGSKENWQIIRGGIAFTAGVILYFVSTFI